MKKDVDFFLGNKWLNYSPEAVSSHSDSDVIEALSAIYRSHTPLIMESMSEIPRLP